LRGISAIRFIKIFLRAQAIRRSNDSMIAATNHKLQAGFSARIDSNSNILP